LSAFWLGEHYILCSDCLFGHLNRGNVVNQWGKPGFTFPVSLQIAAFGLKYCILGDNSKNTTSGINPHSRDRAKYANPKNKD